jgi:hypothetical protein
MVIAGFVLSQPFASAVGSSGTFNPQTQFPVGSTITFNSLNGAAALQDNFTKPKFTQYTASFTITAQVLNFTKDGGIRWKVLGGTFTINKPGDPLNGFQITVPANGFTRVVREDPNHKGLLVAGTEFGLFVSLDGGRDWKKFMTGLPTVRVDDILIHPRDRDLIIATHGRSLWIADDITPLEQLAAQGVNAQLASAPGTAVRMPPAPKIPPVVTAAP